MATVTVMLKMEMGEKDMTTKSARMMSLVIIFNQNNPVERATNSWGEPSEEGQ